MVRRFTILLSACVAALVIAVPALARPAVSGTGSSVTATGTGQANVVPKNRHSNASIAAAYEVAHEAAIKAAMSEAREYALEYAQAAGLTLGAVTSVSDAQNGFYGPGGFFGTPFGPGQFCGTVHQPVFKKVNGHRKVVRVKKVHRCFVPPFAYTTLTVTYAAS
jgi:Protein of unknown function (DUF541)